MKKICYFLAPALIAALLAGCAGGVSAYSPDIPKVCHDEAERIKDEKWRNGELVNGGFVPGSGWMRRYILGGEGPKSVTVMVDTGEWEMRQFIWYPEHPVCQQWLSDWRQKVHGTR